VSIAAGRGVNYSARKLKIVTRNKAPETVSRETMKSGDRPEGRHSDNHPYDLQSFSEEAFRKC